MMFKNFHSHWNRWLHMMNTCVTLMAGTRGACIFFNYFGKAKVHMKHHMRENQMLSSCYIYSNVVNWFLNSRGPFSQGNTKCWNLIPCALTRYCSTGIRVNFHLIFPIIVYFLNMHIFKPPYINYIFSWD
jgi:hypothetical protein